MLILVYISIETMRISFYVLRLCIRVLKRVFYKLLWFFRILVATLGTLLEKLYNFLIFTLDVLLPRQDGGRKRFGSRGLGGFDKKGVGGKILGGFDTAEDFINELVKINTARILSSFDEYSIDTSGTIAFSELGGDHSAHKILVRPNILFHYKNPAIKRSIWNAKYYKDPACLDFLAGAWSDELISDMTDRVGGFSLSQLARKLILHPPSSSHAKGEKDFDQMILLVEKMINDFSLDNFYIYLRGSVVHSAGSSENALSELGLGEASKSEVSKGVLPESQHKGNRAQRIVWSKNRFRLSGETSAILEKLYTSDCKTGPVVRVICIDDILTTGATMVSVRDTVKNKFPNIEVSFSTLAH
jgi:predicted amidophosphoribosyltransferase